MCLIQQSHKNGRKRYNDKSTDKYVQKKYDDTFLKALDAAAKILSRFNFRKPPIRFASSEHDLKHTTHVNDCAATLKPSAGPASGALVAGLLVKDGQNQTQKLEPLVVVKIRVGSVGKLSFRHGVGRRFVL